MNTGHWPCADFPVLLGRLLGQGPPSDVRAALAENIYEEQTGKLSFGVPHPELFLEMMDGLGFARRDLDHPEPLLEPEALAYRAFLDRVSGSAPWVVGAAVLTIFVEGSVNERAELEGTRHHPPIEEVVAAHPMVADLRLPGRARCASCGRSPRGRRSAIAPMRGAWCSNHATTLSPCRRGDSRRGACARRRHGSLTATASSSCDGHRALKREKARTSDRSPSQGRRFVVNLDVELPGREVSTPSSDRRRASRRCRGSRATLRGDCRLSQRAAASRCCATCRSRTLAAHRFEGVPETRSRGQLRLCRRSGR